MLSCKVPETTCVKNNKYIDSDLILCSISRKTFCVLNTFLRRKLSVKTLIVFRETFHFCIKPVLFVSRSYNKIDPFR